MLINIQNDALLSSDDMRVVIIYIIVFSISMFFYRKWKNYYKNIPDKTTDATLLSTRSYDSHYGYAESRHAPYILGKYEFYINGKRHTTKFKFFSYPPEKSTLYYKKGAWDIRWDKNTTFKVPIMISRLALLYFIFGVIFIAVGIDELFFVH